MARARGKRVPPVVTAAYLERVVGTYLERYFTTRFHLRRLLMRRVYRSARYHHVDPADGEQLVDALLDRLERARVLDDEAWARGRVRTLRRRGASARSIRAALREKGVPGAIVRQCLDEVDGDQGEPELAAALTYARKRRLGPYRHDPDQREVQAQRDLARLARRGFSYDVSRTVIDAPDVASIQERLDEE